MNVYIRRSVVATLMAAGLAAVMLAAEPAEASPPVSVCGIEVPMVLSLNDHVRLLDWTDARDRPDRADDTENPPEATDRPSSDETVPNLEQVDTIVLDPGHGGGNSGAIGVAKIKEKFLTLELAFELRRTLQTRHPDLRVVLTRYWDRQMSLSERTHLANRVDADLFLSLHYNGAVHDRAVGFETYFLEAEQVVPGGGEKTGEPLASATGSVTGVQREEKLDDYGVHDESFAVLQRDLRRARQHKYSGRLAETVQEHLRDRLDSTDRGVKQGNFGVLRGALMPAVVVESGFLTHPKEGETVLTDAHRTRVVDALVEAVEEFDRLKSEATPDPRRATD